MPGYSGRRYIVDLVNSDFVKLAESYGANGLPISYLKDFSSAVYQALSGQDCSGGYTERSLLAARGGKQVMFEPNATELALRPMVSCNRYF